jgi:hypothetical protein
MQRSTIQNFGGKLLGRSNKEMMSPLHSLNFESQFEQERGYYGSWNGNEWLPLTLG